MLLNFQIIEAEAEIEYQMHDAQLETALLMNQVETLQDAVQDMEILIWDAEEALRGNEQTGENALFKHRSIYTRHLVFIEHPITWPKIAHQAVSNFISKFTKLILYLWNESEQLALIPF